LEIYLTNAFGSTFAFLPTLKANQKMQKSYQANASKHRNNGRTTTRQEKSHIR
jgi:hypothetical protein